MTKNHLKTESSPYLLQHADNPVNWWPWCDEALEQARQQDKPILLSIGYSACHWCHVMAHESFENEAIAKVMNRLFINIKVDREERPDLDKIYQQAYQLLNQRGGGWPLNVFLAPDDLTPFFAGTYFPDQPRHGMPAFTETLEHIEDFYRQNKNDIKSNNQALRIAMHPVLPTVTSQLDSQPIDAARQQLALHFDSAYGGFGAAPKLPYAHCSLLDALAENLTPPRIVIIRDELKNKNNWSDITSSSFANTLVYFIPAKEKDLPGLINNQPYEKGDIAYLCQGTKCFAPLKTALTLKMELNSFK